MTGLILKRAPIGWNQDDFDVLENGKIIGRIFFLDCKIGATHRAYAMMTDERRLLESALSRLRTE